MPRRAPSAATNILRFPVERRARPTLELMRELAPDVGDVLAVTDVFGDERSLTFLRDQADGDAARYLAARRVRGTRTSSDELDRLLNPMVAVAIAICWSLRDAAAATYAARRALRDARTAGQEQLKSLCADADQRRREEVRLLVQAHARVEEAEGVARAVELARLGEVWPRDDWADNGAPLKVLNIAIANAAGQSGKPNNPDDDNPRAA